jgi:TRAP-type C4-dicarboxylate transport system permease small subunit
VAAAVLRRLLVLYGRSAELVDRGAMAFSAGMLAVVVGLNAVEIVARRAGRSSPLLVELSVTLATTMYFVGYAALLRRDDDVVMEYVYRRLPRRGRRWLDLAIALAVLGFFALLLDRAVALFRLMRPTSHPVFPISQSYTVLPLLVAAVACLWVAGYRVVVAAARLTGSGPEEDAAGPGRG